MKIICNDEPQEVRAGISLADFIRDAGLEPDTVVAEYNGTIIKPRAYDGQVLAEGDVLELIRFVGGG